MPNFYAGQTDYISKLNLLATSEELEAYATIIGSGNGKFPLGNAGTPSISFATDTNTGMFSSAADILNFAVGGTNKLTLNSAGLTVEGTVNLATGNTFKINNITVLSTSALASSVLASSLTSVGTITSGTWSAGFGSVSGANLTNITAANIVGAMPAISGANLISLTAANLIGPLPVISGSNLTNLTAANLIGSLPAISGANLTNLTAANLIGTWASMSGGSLSLSNNLTFTTSTADISNVASLNGGQLAGFRNRIINGQMIWDQRYSGAAQTPVADSYILDRWKMQMSVASKFTVQQVIDAPPGFFASSKITVASAYTPLAADFFIYRQYIEASNTTDFQMGTASAQSIALSFWVKGSVAGTYSGVISNSGTPRAYPFTYTVTTSWARQTVIIPGDTAGSWVTGGPGVGIGLLFDLGSGTNYQSTANAWSGANPVSVTGATKFVSQTPGATLNITGVQLEIGTVATEFEQRSIGAELVLCQRYLELVQNTFIGFTAAASVNIGGRTKYAVVKRASPIVSQLANNVSVSQVNVATTVSTFVGTDTEGFTFYRTTSTAAAGTSQYSETCAARAEY